MKVGVQSLVYGYKPFKDVIGEIKKLDVDFVEIRPLKHSDINCVGHRKGKIYFKPSSMKYVADLCDGLPFQFHFADTMCGSLKNLCTGDSDVTKFLLDYAGAESKYFPDFVLTNHMLYGKRDKEGKTVYDINPVTAFNNVKDAVDELYKNWDFPGSLTLETMPEPYVYLGAALLGYRPEHFERILEGKEDKFGVCIDTGHVNDGLNNGSGFSDFTHLNVKEVHFHGNYSHYGERIWDTHTLPLYGTLKDYDLIKDYLKDFDGLINFELTDIMDKPWVRHVIDDLRENY